MEKRKRKRFLAWLCTMAVIISGMVPTNVTYATVLQQETAESQAQDIVSEEDIVDCLDISESECSEGCVLDDGITVFDTWEENKSATVLSEENEPSEKQVVNEVVVFISFSDKGESIYEERGGYDYIMSMFDGADPSLKSYVDEYSWGQVEANTYVWPQNSDGTPKCYVDEHPSSYYLKQSTSNPNGYTSSEKYTRRQTLLKNAIASMGEDFLEQIGIAGEPYNLVFMVPNEGSWNDLLWSHKSSITINGVSTVYNLITYNTNKKNITKTVTHEFMHSLG